MRPLSESTPKPLLPVGGMPLIERHVVNLARAGITDIVVNVSYLADKLVTFLGSGHQWGVRIQISREPEPLETAGGVRRALPLLGTGPFLVVNGDIYSDFPFDQLLKQPVSTAAAHLVWVDNPSHHRNGDFYLENGVVVAEVAADEDQASIAKLNKAVPLTFAGIGCYSPTFFAGDLPEKQTGGASGAVRSVDILCLFVNFQRQLRRSLALFALQRRRVRWFFGTAALPGRFLP